MGIAETKRKLLPTFKFMEKTLAWQCDLCEKKFFLNDIQEADPEMVAPHVMNEFLLTRASGRGWPLMRGPRKMIATGKSLMIDRNDLFPDKHPERE